IGAGVPSPSSAKRANESTTPGTPIMIKIPPRMRVRSTPKKAGRNSHCVTHQGTKPASTNGAMTKNRAEPKTAIAFDIACSPRPDKNRLATHLLLRALNAAPQLVVPAVEFSSPPSLPSCRNVNAAMSGQRVQRLNREGLCESVSTRPTVQHIGH